MNEAFRCLFWFSRLQDHLRNGFSLHDLRLVVWVCIIPLFFCGWEFVILGHFQFSHLFLLLIAIGFRASMRSETLFIVYDIFPLIFFLNLMWYSFCTLASLALNHAVTLQSSCQDKFSAIYCGMYLNLEGGIR